jgi:hypothetical protein
LKYALAVVFACGPQASPAVPTPDLAVGPHVACPAPTATIRALVDRLDADADPLHSDHTPSVHGLVERGVAGGCAVLDALGSENVDTRLHAERVVEGVIELRYGFRAGRGFRDQYDEERVATTLRAIDYHHDGTLDARRRGIQRIRDWLEHPAGPSDDTLTGGGPSADEMRAALDGVKPALVACGEPVDLTVTFGGSGHVESIFGTASTDAAYRACLQDATRSISLRPFGRASVWTRYIW